MTRRIGIPLGALAVAVVAAGAAGLGAGEAVTAQVPPQESRPHRYDIEYPVMDYPGGRLTDPVANLQRKLDSDEAVLAYDASTGYLRSLLGELGIGVESQTLVFSRTSAQIAFISPSTPRALYFTDDVYVAWPPEAPDIEIAAMDPNLGPVFYTLSQDENRPVQFERKMDECLRCHDTYSLTGGGVPRLLLGSGFTDSRGQQVSHEGWILVDDRTPLEFRWGGWYVTGTHGTENHMGNWVIRDPEELRDMDLSRTGNVTDLAELIDTGRYLGPDSDIVALMVLDHQTHIQSVMTRVNYETRKLLDTPPGEPAPDTLSTDTESQLGAIAEPLVEALLMVGQPALTDTISGTSGFADTFTSAGPFDGDGRTLREFDLSQRLFRYPCSYVIYSEAFDALPRATRQYVFARLHSILSGEDASPTFAHLSPDDRQAILEILESTKPGFRTVTAG